MKLLVIGATGLLGSAVWKEGNRRGHEVIAAARANAPLRLDVTDFEQLESVLYASAPDALINCAALTDIAACEADPGLAYRVNARPLAILAAWSRAIGRPLVQISTDHYFTKGAGRPHAESEPVSLVNEYARTKYAGERFALLSPAALVLRTSIVGIRGWEKPTLAEWAIAAIERDEPLTLFEDAFTSSIDVVTFARALFDLLERRTAGLLNLASSQVYSKADFVRALAARIGRELAPATAGSVAQLQPSRPKSLGLDVSAAERQLGYALPGLESVAAAVVEQYEESLKQ